MDTEGMRETSLPVGDVRGRATHAAEAGMTCRIPALRIARSARPLHHDVDQIRAFGRHRVGQLLGQFLQIVRLPARHAQAF